ncbi:hypothetical protein ACQEVY_19310 [Streptomyces sp. CA-288835]|uniref:hypothetical protein n=1 Tax=Streptomyces sp. CA-288835 TaxID=3240069 RepID=UPI003D8B5E4B
MRHIHVPADASPALPGEAQLSEHAQLLGQVQLLEAAHAAGLAALRSLAAADRAHGEPIAVEEGAP